MNASDDEDNFELSMSESPTSRPVLAPNPFLAAIGSALPSLTGRVTRSQRSAIQPLATEISRISPNLEPATSDVLPTSTNPMAPLSQNLGANEGLLFEEIQNLPSDSEVRFTFNDLQRIMNLFAINVPPIPPVVSEPHTTYMGTSIRSPGSLSEDFQLSSVPRSEYTDVTSAQSKYFTSLPRFSNSDKGNRDNMQTFMVALAECELLTLANGDRSTPIISDRNPNGYSPRTIHTNPNGSITVIPADDIFKRDHDVKKLLVILNIVTAKDLHYLIKRVMVENDAVTWFSTIYDHINGTKNIDIRKAMDNLSSIKLKPHVSIMENIANIEEAFRIVKVATGSEITDEQKLYYLQEKLEADTRMSVVSTMALSKTDRDDYATTLRKLVMFDPAPSVAHRLSSLDKTAEPCRRHLAGLCQNGAQCKYSHAP